MESVSLFFYRFFQAFYRWSAFALAPFQTKAAKWVAGRRDWHGQWKETLKKSGITYADTIVWMHVASSGEMEQGRPVLEAIRKTFPSVKVVVSFFSPSGYEAACHDPVLDAAGYLPHDHPRNARKWLELLKPALILWVKYEFWYFILKEIHFRQIPLLLISARFRNNQLFFRWYGGIYRNIPAFFTHLFVQDSGSASLLRISLPDDQVSISGDTRFDSVLAVSLQPPPPAVQMLEKWCNSHPVVVAGSTWPGDEALLSEMSQKFTGMKWIVVPHHVDAASLQKTLALFPGAVVFSQFLENPGIAGASGSHVLVLDQVGLLRYLYRLGTITYVGGGFTRDGIHNVPEAAVYGKPVLHGPEFSKYPEAQALLEAGGSKVIRQSSDLEKVLSMIISHPQLLAETGHQAAVFVQIHGGATAHILAFIQEKRLLTSSKK